jgi:hypothetical protein
MTSFRRFVGLRSDDMWDAEFEEFAEGGGRRGSTWNGFDATCAFDECIES